MSNTGFISDLLRLPRTYSSTSVFKKRPYSYPKFRAAWQSYIDMCLRTENWPKAPRDLKSIEDLFSKADETLNKRWLRWTSMFLKKTYASWQSTLPWEELDSTIVEILLDPELLHEKMKLKELRQLTSLRQTHLPIWQSLLQIASMYQLAKIEVLHTWISDLKEEKVAKMGMTKHELMLFLEIAKLVGSHTDETYIHSLKPTFKVKHPQSVIRKTHQLAKKAEQLLAEKLLLQEYRFLPKYLTKLAQVYQNTPTIPSRDDARWLSLYNLHLKMIKANCPILIIPQSATGIENIEMRLCIRTKRTQEIEQMMEPFIQTAQTITNSYEKSLHKLYEIRAVCFNYQAFAFGVNITIVTKGESSHESSYVHANSIEQTAVAMEIPLLKRLYHRLSIHLHDYLTASVMQTGLHELGHVVLSFDDKKIAKRIGYSTETYILDELKAETTGVHIFTKTELNYLSATQAKYYLLALIGALSRYIADGDGTFTSEDEYYNMGLVMMSILLKDKYITKYKGKYILHKPKEALRAWAKTSQKLLNLYARKNTKPELIVNYRKSMHRLHQGKLLREYIAACRS